MADEYNTTEIKIRRLKNALWSLFIGDALAMPAHWYYNTGNIVKDFEGGIRGYVDPPHPHPESFMVGMGYHPDVASAERLGRAYDILHEHARFYNTSYSALQIRSTDRESEHGNPVPQLDDRYHYHHGLKAGENTLAALFSFTGGQLGSRVMAEKLKGRTIRRIFGGILLVFVLKLIQNVFL